MIKLKIWLFADLQLVRGKRIVQTYFVLNFDKLEPWYGFSESMLRNGFLWLGFHDKNQSDWQIELIIDNVSLYFLCWSKHHQAVSTILFTIRPLDPLPSRADPVTSCVSTCGRQKPGFAMRGVLSEIKKEIYVKLWNGHCTADVGRLSQFIPH